AAVGVREHLGGELRRSLPAGRRPTRRHRPHSIPGGDRRAGRCGRRPPARRLTSGRHGTHPRRRPHGRNRRYRDRGVEPGQSPAGVGLAMGFGAGALISALAYELIPDSRVADAGVWLAFAAGALLYYGLNAIVERGGPTTGLPIVLGALLDGVPESLVLGLGVA